MSEHILIIEDNDMSLALADHLLRRAGYTTSTAIDGLSGLRLALENKSQLILCDLDLPAMDGAEVVRALRADAGWRKVPVLAFTASSLSDEQRRMLASGFDGCIAKPIDPATFTATVAVHLQSELRVSRG
jgi:CheY-like chemotaxis protein